jgi:hypothetical protein
MVTAFGKWRRQMKKDYLFLMLCRWRRGSYNVRNVALLQQSSATIKKQEKKRKPQVTNLFAEFSYARAGDLSVIMTKVGALVKFPPLSIASHHERRRCPRYLQRTILYLARQLYARLLEPSPPAFLISVTCFGVTLQSKAKSQALTCLAFVCFYQIAYFAEYQVLTHLQRTAPLLWERGFVRQRSLRIGIRIPKDGELSKYFLRI